MLDSVSWVVHPLAGMTLAFLASVIFSKQGRQSPRLLGAFVLLLALSVLGAGWVVHPAAGITIALVASLAFHAWRSEWRTLLAAFLALTLFSALGAGWAVFPLLGLGMAWLVKVVFSGELFRATLQETAMQTQAAAFPGTPQSWKPQPLPAQGGGEVFHAGGGMQEARAGRKLQRKVAKLERKAERLGVPLQVRLEKSAPLLEEVQPQPEAPPTIRTPAGGLSTPGLLPTGLLALSRDERLPEGARARLGALHFRCREASSYLKDRGQDALAGNGFLLGQIETDYALEAVQAYLKLPPSLANVTPLQDGKTGQVLLQEQLDLLLSAVQTIMQDAAQAGGQHLLAHQRFLKERFARREDDLKL